MICDIIILDDDRDIGTMLQLVLSLNYERVKHCLNRNELFECLKYGTPKMIILDVFISGVDGRDVCRELRQVEVDRSVPILMMSAAVDAEQTCMEAGADCFLAKPFDIEHLMKHVVTLIK